MLMMFACLFICFVALTMAIVPRPKIKPAPELNAPRLQRSLPEPEFDPLAFWLFPDWDGPIEEPFWMRAPKQPAKSVDRYDGVDRFVRDCADPNAMPRWIEPLTTPDDRRAETLRKMREHIERTRGGAVPVLEPDLRVRMFVRDENGEEITVFHMR